ncbi:hypothetical protein ABZ297_45850 [Nonomuraea sp. NPDC005983]|uniref:hypothetical protein n=1 Tax=Nonomuraea sp. NPDC005983 TaxID=3155595 RepID=UPI0033A82AD8
MDDPADTLRRDSAELAALARRLRDLAVRLRADGVAPPWFEAVLNGQIMRCTLASAHLADAARRVQDHAEALRRRPRP